MSRWRNWSRGTNPAKMLSDFLKEGPVDQARSANPTGNGQLDPATRARQLGLQSNGKGGYIDPQTGQIVARTVNNELVFYSSAPGGGAVSDGSGGSAIANPSTAWQDPVSGLMTTPPGQPESPNELAAVPDPVPALAPAGYNAFINQKKQEIYVQDKMAREQPQPPAEVDPDQEVQQDPAMMEPTAVPGMPMGENYLGADLLKRTGGLGPPTFSDMRDRVKRSQIGQQQVTPPNAGEGGGQVRPAAPTPTQYHASAQYTPDPDEDDETPAPQAAPQQGITLADLRAKAQGAWQKDFDAKPRARDTVESLMNKYYSPFETLMEGADPKFADPLLRIIRGAYDYEGRDPDASKDISLEEYKLLKKNRDRILKGYGGDGRTPDMNAIRDYQKLISGGNIDEELAEKAFAALPAAAKKIFTGGTYSSPMNGFKKFLRQNQQDGYTDLPLDINTMQMEHFIDSSMANDILKRQEGKNKKERIANMSKEDRELYEFILGDENQFWARMAPNERKGNSTPADFFENEVDVYDQFGDDYFKFRDDEIKASGRKVKGEERDYVKSLIEEDDDGNKTLVDMDEEGFNSHRDTVNNLYSSQKQRLADLVREKFDQKKGLYRMGQQVFDRKVADENLPDITEEDRPTYNLMQRLKSAVNSQTPDFERKLLQALGLKTKMTLTERPRGTNAPADIYRALASSLKGLDKPGQIERISNIKDALLAANSEGEKARGSGDNAVVRNATLRSLIRSGLFEDDVIEQYPGLKRLRDTFLNMTEGVMDEETDIPQDEIPEILEMIMEIMEHGGVDMEDALF